MIPASSPTRAAIGARAATKVAEVRDASPARGGAPILDEHDKAERIRLLVDTINDYAIVLLDTQGLVTTWNAGATRIKGYAAGEIIGQSFLRFYGPDDVADGRPQSYLHTAEVDGRDEHEGWLVRKDGDRFWANVVITAIHDASGQLQGFGTVVRDMTEHKRHEMELQEKNLELQDAVGELEAFSYSVSHDLRAPLRAINAFSRIVLEQNAATLGEELLGFLRLVRDNAVQMGQLVDDLLAFSRLNRAPLTKQIVHVNGMVEAVVATHRTEGREVWVAVGDLPDVLGDPSLLRQVLINLIDNAFKYTRTRAKAHIEIGAQVIDGETVIFVRDNGVGFDMRYANKLFDVFTRLHRAEDFEGTGVGLAIVQRIVQRHGCRIWAEAEVDKGATFFFTVEPVGT